MDIGVVVQPQATLDGTLDDFARAEALGVHTAWFAQTPFGLDAVTMLALAATRTGSIRLGTSVIPSFPRHPMVAAAQARTAAAAAPDRFVLGVSVGHRSWIEQLYGLEFARPVGHIRDWIHTVRRLIDGEAVTDADNAFGINAPASVATGAVPIVLAATGPQMLAVAGEVADGAMTWMCDEQYLAEIVMPAVSRGSNAAGRSAPPVAVGVVICVTDHQSSARTAIGKVLGPLGNYDSYRQALDRLGATGRGPADVALIGTEDHVRTELDRLAAAGAAEIIAVVMPDPDDPRRTVSRSSALLAALGNNH